MEQANKKAKADPTTTTTSSSQAEKEVEMEEAQPSSSSSSTSTTSTSTSSTLPSSSSSSTELPSESFAPVEEKVGIEMYLGTHEGFNGILKQRYGDFVVSEIDPNGKVVELSNLEPPFVEKANASEKSDEEAFTAMVGAEKTAEFFGYMKSRVEDKKSKFIFPPEEDKLKRTQLHKLIKERFEGTLTETQGNSVVVMPASQARTRRDDVSSWPEGKGKYVEFVLYKENRETTAALLVLSQMLRTTTKTFSFAGTKDKRGVTVQRATAFRINPERMSAINPKLFGMRVGNFEYVDKPLRLGDLQGNRFQIAIRDVTASDEAIKTAVSNLMKTGFINYYGLQRFGTGQVATNHVGLALLKKDWAGAAHLVLDPRQGETAEATEARTYFQKTGDIKGTLDKLPPFLSVERMLLRGFKKSGPTSYLNAFSMIPRTMRMMYAHAYQSYVWNCMVSERIRLFGFEAPVEGDLVAVDLVTDTEQTEELDLQNTTESEIEAQQEIVQETFKVVTVSKDDVQQKKYTIDQVVLPLPGYEVIYPSHIIAQKMKEMLVKDGLDPDNLQRAQKEYDLKGAYRKIIVKPAEFSWKIMHYDDVMLPLIPTDTDKLSNNPPPADIPEGKFKALILNFNLPSSSYATMLFRELLKVATSKLTQKTLSDEFAYRQNKKKPTGDGNFNKNRFEKEKGKRKRDNADE